MSEDDGAAATTGSGLRVSRRGLLLGGLGTLGLPAAVAWEARHRNPYQPVLERVDIPLPERYAHLAGTKIGFVTDTHVGPFISGDDLARATALMADAQPDVLLLGGDYISESPRFIATAAEVLGTLAKTTPLGGYAVLGNHDWANGDDQVESTFTQAGLTVLRDRSVPIPTERGSLWLVGLDDALLAFPDPDVAFADVPDGAPSVVLWHEPDWATVAARRGALLQLSGHSHGGQVRLPGIGPLSLPVGGRRYVIGLNHAEGMPIYTARGVGVFRPPVRLNCPPEVTLLTLVGPDS